MNADSYVGVDIKISGHNHQSSKVDCFYDGKTLPFPTGHFDAVVCFEVLEHVFNLDEVLAEIKRVLKPNGQVLVTIPFAWDEHEVPYDFARYTSYGIKHIFEKNEFDVVEIRKSTTYVFAACQMFIAYLAQHVSPKEGIPRRLFQLFLIFPLNSLALGLDAVLPKRFEYFCNSIVLARKPS